MRLYISGPMTGIKDYNFPAFHEAAKKISEIGHCSLNPAEDLDGNPLDPSYPYTKEEIHELFRNDVAYLLMVHGVVVIEGWEKSKGANVEVSVALLMGLPIYKIVGDDLEQIPESEIETAIVVKSKEKNADR